jgi:hypothetical protein
MEISKKQRTRTASLTITWKLLMMKLLEVRSTFAARANNTPEKEKH